MTSEYLSALGFLHPDLGQEVLGVMHMASEHPVRLVTTVPVFALGRATQTIQSVRPQVVLVDSKVPGFSLPEALELRRQSDAPFLLVGLAPAGSAELEAMLGAGLDAVFSLPISHQTFDSIGTELPLKFQEVADGWGKGAFASVVPESLRAVLADAGGQVWQRQAIGVWSPKGGPGKTTVAIEMAAVLATLGGRKVALVDANMNGGHIKLRLNVRASHSILNAANIYHQCIGNPALEREIPRRLSELMVRVSGTDNLHVLPGIVNMQQATHDAIAGERGAQFAAFLVDLLKREYDFVIVDLGSSMNVGAHVGAIQKMDYVLVVCTPDLTSISDAREGVHRTVIPRTGMDERRFGMVINRWQENLGISLKEASSYARISAVGVIPEDTSGKVTEAGNSGISFFARYSPNKTNPASTEETLSGFATLAAHFYPPISAAWSERLKKPRKRGWLGGLLAREARG